MTNETKNLIIRILENAKGDDLYRTRIAFKNCSEEELNSQYGESGSTRRQIIEGYEKKEEMLNKVINEFKELVK